MVYSSSYNVTALNATTLNATPAKYSVVVVGHFNRMILTPKWFLGRLTTSEQCDISVAIDNPSAPWIFGLDNVDFSVSTRRLEFTPKRLDVGMMAECAAMAKKALQELPHTPVTACGINFNFICKDVTPESDLCKVFNFSDNHSFADLGGRLRQSKIERQFTFDKCILTISLAFEGSTAKLGFNHNVNCKHSSDAIEFLETDMKEFWTQNQKILNDAYQLTVE